MEARHPECGAAGPAGIEFASKPVETPAPIIEAILAELSHFWMRIARMRGDISDG
jgi:hypothetical protein